MRASGTHGERLVNNTLQIERPNQRYLQHFALASARECNGRCRRPARPCLHGIGDVVEIANPASVARASKRDATLQRPRAKPSPAGPAALASVAVEEWRALADRAVEPNGYYLPDWA